jgi:hypothetical protein
MIWASCVERMGEKRNANRILGRSERRSHWEDPDIDGRTVLKRMSDIYDGGGVRKAQD